VEAPKRDVPFVPTTEPVVEAILDFAGLRDGDVLYDLGCGDGRIVIGAARRGVRAVGVDVDRLRIRECHWNAHRAGDGVQGRVRFVRGSLFDIDLGDATVVTLYLLPSVNRRLRPKLLWELKPGTRVLSNFFDMDDWRPDARLDVHQRTLYRWTIPAWVEGRWNCSVNFPTGRRHLVVRLRRKYQVLSGSARLGRETVPLADATLAGDSISFTIPRGLSAGLDPVRFLGAMKDGCLRGTCTIGGSASQSVPWGGVRHP
jgi:precorrin-6B methylase 2